MDATKVGAETLSHPLSTVTLCTEFVRASYNLYFVLYKWNNFSSCNGRPLQKMHTLSGSAPCELVSNLVDLQK